MNSNKRGFTIIELMIAISVLAVVLLLISVGIIQISKTYYKGIVQSTTQQTNRALIQDISNSIAYGSFSGLQTATLDRSGTYPSLFVIKSFCFGTNRYSYVPTYQLAANGATSGYPSGGNVAAGNSKHVLWKDIDSSGGCAPVDVSQSPITSPTTSGREMLGEHMRLTQMSVTLANPCSPTQTAGCSDTLFKITTTVMYGDDDLIDTSDADPANWTCKPTNGVFGAAFCAKSNLTTVIAKRLS